MKLPTALTAEARKFQVALVAALGVLATALQDGHVTSSEYIAIAAAFLGAFGVYVTTNKN